MKLLELFRNLILSSVAGIISGYTVALHFVGAKPLDVVIFLIIVLVVGFICLVALEIVIQGYYTQKG